MGVGHCFISYSTADGVNFLQDLVRELEGVEPHIPAWYDTRNIAPGSNWDDEIVEAIKACKCMLFVMSTDSTKPSSDCRKEILFALRYKKSIIPLLIHKTAEPIFMIATREWIDFADFNVGMGKLRKYVYELELPVGQLRLLKERLSDAEHDLRRATGEEANRIKGEIEELNKQIETQKKIAENPKAAEEQTQANIAAGLERERQSKESAEKKTFTKFINPPPGIAPAYFQDRTAETGEIVRFLHDDAQRMMTIVGRGGVGKTAMVCRLLKHLENSSLPEDITKTFPQTRVDGIVYLSESGSHRVNFANIFYDLCKLLPIDIAQELDTIYKNPQGSTESKMRALLEKFGSGRMVLLLDNFEPLVDTETFAIRDAELDEALRTFLNGTHTAVKVVITTRVAPQILNRKVQPGRQRILDLDDGLEQKYATKMLREMDADGKLALKKAKAQLLKLAHKRTLGYPRALEALVAILASDRYTTLEEILARAENYLPDEVVEALVGEAFNRLDVNAQKVMQALAVYNHNHVTPAAVDYLLAPHIPAIDSALILQRLANMHFARKESGRFYLHPVDREFAFGLIPVEDLTTNGTKEKQKKSTVKTARPEKEDFAFLLDSFRSSGASWFNKFIKHDLTLRAADYFRKARKPRAEWKKLDDLAAQLAEFELRCDAGDYDTACSVLESINSDCLLLWGHYRLIIQLHNKVMGKIGDPFLQMVNHNSLGVAYQQLGEARQSRSYFEQGILASQHAKNRQAEGAFLGNLGGTYSALGDERKAIEYYELALVIHREIGDRKGEESGLSNLGNTYSNLGDARKAIEYYEKALLIAREIGSHTHEGATLSGLGLAYADLGEIHQAIKAHEERLLIARKINDRRGEASALGNLGLALLSLGNHQKAVEVFLQAIEIADEISYPIVQKEERWGLAQVYLLQNDFINAHVNIEAALQYDLPEYNHNTTALYGIIALRQGERETAQEAFMKSIAQADEILAKTPDYYEALDAKGMALCGSAVSREWKVENSKERDEIVAEAVETFRKARKIAPHAGVVKRNLRLFDELVKCDEEGVLKHVREVIEGK